MQKVKIYLAGLFDQERNALFYWSAVIYALGIGIYFSLSFEPPLSLIAVALVFVALVQYFVRSRAALLLSLRALIRFILKGKGCPSALSVRNVETGRGL